MPCIHLYIPKSNSESVKKFSWQMTSNLKCRIADAAQVNRDDVKIFFHSRETAIVMDDGTLADCSQVFGEVYWYSKENRDQRSMDTIAGALQHFLYVHGLGKGFDLTFFGFPAGAFYAEKHGVAVLVPGGEPAIPFSLLHYTVFEATGWNAEGFDPDDAVLF